MYVFRSERRVAPGEDLLGGLRNALSRASQAGALDEVLDALLRAGELECALADTQTDADQLTLICSITDALADCLLKPSEPGRHLLERVAQLRPPQTLCVSKPEGFAYYALHPLDYALLANSFCHGIHNAAVIGLRSIGTTLSAVVTSALRRRGILTERITTRPQGHPFDRQCRFSDEQVQWLRSYLYADAHFFVVDEGPGLSGSSLLSVAEALVAAGVPSARITLFCSHQPDPERLRARDAARRWKSFHSEGIPFGTRKPADADQWLGAGLWRAHLLPAPDPPEVEWPASWTHVERSKYLARGGSAFCKFEGLGRYGKEVVSRSRQLAEACFGPRLLHALDSQGYAYYECLDGSSFYGNSSSSGETGEDVLRNLARYCAWRARELACDSPQASSDEVSLQEMCYVNASEEFGSDMHTAGEFLPCERPVIADARMMPHEWIRTPSGALMKTDGAGHGDDHFFPGPCDIAWDLAGVIIEWQLSPVAADFFIHAYRRLSGDNPRSRLDHYLLAYSLFRMGYTQMAFEAMQGSDEEGRLRRAFGFYREAACFHLNRNGFAATQETAVTLPATLF
ncbi:MAG TPA: hypothetical protein VK699_08510 [Terriglobales bacterium]|jgi:hypothetical protein|nr:hypothetical protein [Terriglobales bacterium]